jgi:endonuclease/exonuclease/phosphatase family metal-dependent hydrolase
MTLNIWNYNRPWPIRRRLIADLITSHRPDVVALQEDRHDFRYERGKGQGKQLAELTDYHLTSAVAQVYLPIFRVDEGLAILTPGLPRCITIRRLTQLPHEREDENRRICLSVAIDHAGSTVHIFDAHFSLSAVARESNALEVARFVEEQAGDAPAVLMGDLNAEPSTPPIRFLVGEGDIAGTTADFVDCWEAANPNDVGFTYASFGPVRRIDYILARNLPQGKIEAALVGAEAADGVYPSDHLGIMVDLPL